MTRRLLLLLITLPLALMAAAQHVPIRVMSQVQVEGAEESRSLSFDSYGLMWIGTNQGVRAYDGNRFRTYRSDAYTIGTLPNNNVIAIAHDKHEGTWIGTRDGLVRFDRGRGRFKVYRLPGEQPHVVDALFTAADGTVWVGTNRGAARYDATTDSFRDIGVAVGARAFAEDKLGNIYIGTWGNGLLRLNKKSGRLVNYPKMNDRDIVSSLLIDSQGRLWIGTWEHGIVRLDHPENESAPGIHKVNDGRHDFRTFHRLGEDPVSHSVWGCCIEGLTRVSLDDPLEAENYPNPTFCYDIVTDGRGNLWVATRNDGIVHLTTVPSPFRFCHLDPTGQELPVNRIQSVFTTDGQHFWLGLQPYGLAWYDRGSGSVSYNTRIPGFSQMTGVGGIYAQSVNAFLDRGNGETWMACSGGIIVAKEGRQARMLEQNAVPFLRGGNVTALYRLHNGAVIIGQTGGVGVTSIAAFGLNDNNDKATVGLNGHTLTLKANGRDLSHCSVRSIIEDHKQQVWLSTEGDGIIRIAGNIGTSSRQPLSVKQYAPSLGNYPIDEAIACHEDAQHRLWAISASGGLFLYDARADRFDPVNHKLHVHAGALYSINSDRKGWLWLSTDKGLVRLKVDSAETKTAFYGVEDGLESIRFSPNGSFHDGTELFYGTTDGFFAFKPCQIKRWQQRVSASLIVSELIIDDQPYRWLDSVGKRKISAEPPFYTRKITIPASVDKFSVEFTLLTYLNQQQCRYAYKLQGYDRDWHYTTADDRRATYQNLPAGTYELQLRGIDSYGRVVDMPYTIEVKVLPPWYLSWWAWLAYIAALIAAVYVVKEWYRNRVNRRARLQQRVSELLHYRELMVMKQFEGANKALEVEAQQHSSPDEVFISKAIACVKQHLNDSDYDREQFARDMLVSSSTLYNKLRALTGQNVTAFINGIRLKEACQMVRRNPDISVNELSMAVGFNTPKYFAKCFKKEFGELPSEFIEKVKAGQ